HAFVPAPHVDHTHPDAIISLATSANGEKHVRRLFGDQAIWVPYVRPGFTLSKWVGESEKGVREVFKKARQAAPCVIFFDELDAIAPRRGGGGEADSHVTERVISQMLTEMDGLEDLKGVVVIGATNRPDILDEALLRPGRFDRLLEVPPPDKEARKQIFQIYTRKKPLDPSVNIDRLAEMTDGYTGADIAAVVNAAAISAIKDYVSATTAAGGGKGAAPSAKAAAENKDKDNKAALKITAKDFEAAMDKVKRGKRGEVSSGTHLVA
ncbi:MAG: hypothetical protein C4292_05335, partial [Nitrososphaera sp.]